MNFLFGLDSMKRHRCSVDFLEMHLKFPELLVSIPFLKEHEIKKENQLTKSNSEYSNPELTKNQSMNHEDKIKELMSCANLDHDNAKQILEKCNWDMMLAVQIALGGSQF